jgi:glucuronokinase
VRSASATAPARAALAGNPSDGFGGRTLALALPAFEARVTVEPGGSFDLERALAGGGPEALLAAAVKRLGGRVPGEGFGLRCASTIPPEVGLAGSSAIVVAALRALSDAFGLSLGPDETARLALEAEVEELGIAAGPQDRVVQAHGGLVSMDFAGGAGGWRVELLDPALLPPLFVAWDRGSAAHSGDYHAQLRARHGGGDPEVLGGLERLATLAADAREAVLAGDHARLARCIDGSFDARAAMGPLDPAHVAMVERAREHGAGANYAGSGGAVIGTLPRDPAATQELRRAFEQAGCGFHLPALGRAARRS